MEYTERQTKFLSNLVCLTKILVAEAGFEPTTFGL
nr:MAG TPA: hypothetical protein [Caudoviricetes sp.]